MAAGTGRAPAALAPGRAAAASVRPDPRRRLQLVLAAIWVVDGVLQYQAFMFTKGFAQMLAGTAGGNPAVIAGPITWAARIVAGHLTVTNTAFATIQLLLGLGIAWRPTIRVALAASVAWSLAVWWLGEGLGGVLNGSASPVSGAPGAVILYGLLAVLLWPAEDAGAPFVAARPAGLWPSRAAWLALWGSLSYFSVISANRTAQGLHDMIAGMAAGEPAWLAAVNRGAAGILAHRGLAASVVLATVLAAIAVAVLLPAPVQRVAVIAAIVVAAVVWIAGQDLGGILAGGATDVNSGPLLALIALAYWPGRSAAAADITVRADGAARAEGAPA